MNRKSRACSVQGGARVTLPPPSPPCAGAHAGAAKRETLGNKEAWAVPVPGAFLYARSSTLLLAAAITFRIFLFRPHSLLLAISPCSLQSLHYVLAAKLLPSRTALPPLPWESEFPKVYRAPSENLRQKRCYHFVDSTGTTLAHGWQSGNRLKRLVKGFIDANRFPAHISNDLHRLCKVCKQKLPTHELPSTDRFSTSNRIFK